MEDYFVHESAYIDDDVDIGEGTKIWHFTHILKNTVIGINCIISQNVMIGPQVKIGNGCKIQNNVSIYKGVELEDNVFCGPSAVFTNVLIPRAFIERKDEFKKTAVKRGVTLGANCTIICGITLGEYSFIAAGAVVTKEVKDYALVSGVPARQVGWVCKCAHKLLVFNNEGFSECQYCGNQYRLQDDSIFVIKED